MAQFDVQSKKGSHVFKEIKGAAHLAALARFTTHLAKQHFYFGDLFIPMFSPDDLPNFL